jgi:tRNA(fMet)-specific endonuclease VapC
LIDSDRQLFQQFLQRVEVVGLMPEQNILITQIIQIRQQYRLSLPDAIIVSTAIQMNADLITADQQLHRIPAITSITFT